MIKFCIKVNLKPTIISLFAYAGKEEKIVSTKGKRNGIYKIDQMELLGIFLLLYESHSHRKYQNWNKDKVWKKEKNLSELWVNVKESNV